MRFNFSYLVVPVMVYIFVGCSNNDFDDYGFASNNIYSSEEAMSQAGSREGGPMPAPAMASPMAPPMPSSRMDSDNRDALETKSVPSPITFDKQDTSGKIPLQSNLDKEVAQLVSSDRIIVRTVNMGIEVEDIVTALNKISKIATDMEGWVVDSNRVEKNAGRISLRVPSSSLSTSVESIRAIASKIDFENSTSQDVTEEYVDNVSKLTTLTSTEQALLKLLGQSENVKEALEVQKALSDLQEELESLKGKIKFLEQTSAFSLIDVQLSLTPVLIEVDAGIDQRGWSGEVLRFKSFFYPPKGIEDFTFTWDFGDGTPPVTNHRVSSTENVGEKVTATVAHQFFDEKDSPFMVEMKISGVGESGLIEGKDNLIVTISDRPIIEVFAGDTIQIESGKEVEFSGSFTRPKDIDDLEFVWDFGDGSTHFTEKVEGVKTTAEAVHKYKDYRPYPYTATLTVKGDSKLGEVESQAMVSVFVTESKGWVVGGVDIVNSIKTVVRSLLVVANWLLIVLLWLAIFSPLWIGVTVAGWFLWKRFKRFNQ